MRTYIFIINSNEYHAPRELCEAIENISLLAPYGNVTKPLNDYIGKLTTFPVPENYTIMPIDEYMDTMNDTDEDTETIFNDGQFDADCSFMSYINISKK